MSNELRSLLVVVSTLEFKGDPQHLQQFVAQNKHVESWWNHLPLVYGITTRLSAGEFSTEFQKFMGRATDFFVCEVNPYTIQGVLDRSAWDGFNKDIRDVVKRSKRTGL